MKLFKRYKYLPELLILSFAVFTRFFRLDVPGKFIFDEVYHAFTASEMFKGNPAAWEWWNTPPAGVAYEWTHPPLAKEFMVMAISLFGDNAFAWRFFSAFFGVGVIILIYLITRELFRNRALAILAAAIASLDGLLLVMSRIGMNDIYFLFFILLSLLFLLKDKKLFMSIALGLSLASKWTALFGILILGGIYLGIQISSLKQKIINHKRLRINLLLSPIIFGLIPLIIYLSTYIPFFIVKHSPPGSNMTNIQTFKELQLQMYWYHTGLEATHPYQSTPNQWLLNARPVWIYVDYANEKIANIYALGNPIIMWTGLVALIAVFLAYLKTKKMALGIIIISYLGFFLPWVISPRIMFYYHYLPSVPFLIIGLSWGIYQLLKDKTYSIFALILICLIFVSFLYFFPLWTAVHVPTEFNNTYFWMKSWK